MAESWPGARKLCFFFSSSSSFFFFFYRPWQLTGYWEQGPNDTATQQISTSSASCSFEQIRPLPPLRHNSSATAKQPPARRAPPPSSSHKKLPGLLFLRGPQLHQGVLPQSRSPPRPQLARCVYFRWANIATCLRVQWPALSEVGGCVCVGGGGCVLRLPALQQGHMWSHTATGPRDGSGEFSRHSWGQQIKHTYKAHLHFPRLRKPFPAFISSLHWFYNKEWVDVPRSHHTHTALTFFFPLQYKV